MTKLAIQHLSKTYADGTEATVQQMSADVAAFLTWAAEPSLVDRVRLGWIVMGFLLFAIGTVGWFLSEIHGEDIL